MLGFVEDVHTLRRIVIFYLLLLKLYMHSCTPFVCFLSQLAQLQVPFRSLRRPCRSPCRFGKTRHKTIHVCTLLLQCSNDMAAFARPFRALRLLSPALRRFFQLPSEGLRVLFFGSDRFASHHMQALLDSGEVCAMELVCPPDRTKPSRQRKESDMLPVKQIALRRNLVVHEPDPSVGFEMEGWKAPDLSRFDIGIVVSFGYRIPKRVIEQLRLGVLNVHPSLLPKYRGAAPIQRAIMRGEKRTGVSIIDINSGELDSGDIIAQAEIAIDPSATFYLMTYRLGMLGCKMLIETIRTLDLCRSRRKKQCDSDVARSICKEFRAPKIKKSEGLVDWTKLEAQQVILLWRALHGFLPVYTSFKDKRMLILKLDFQPVAFNKELDPGQLLYCPDLNRIFIGCVYGRAVSCSKLQLATRKPLSPLAFANGYHIPVRHPDVEYDIPPGPVFELPLPTMQ